MAKGAIYVENSDNSKLGKPCDCSYVSINKTCPKTCAWYKNGCYGLNSYVGLINARMNRRARGGSPLDLARAEAAAIDACYGGGLVPAGRPLRLHICGDSRVITGSRIINKAVGRWKARQGGDCWSYTHCFMNVERSIWSNVSMIASITDTHEAKLARDNGYAPTIVVPEFAGPKAFKLEGSDVRWIPCPAQTKDGVKCVNCRLCWDADRLYGSNMGIAFSAHGSKKNVVRKHQLHLKILQ